MISYKKNMRPLRGENRYSMKDAFSIPEIKNNQEESFEP